MVGVSEWMSGWICERVGEWMSGSVNEWVSESVSGWFSGWVSQSINEREGGSVSEWVFFVVYSRCWLHVRFKSIGMEMRWSDRAFRRQESDPNPEVIVRSVTRYQIYYGNAVMVRQTNKVAADSYKCRNELWSHMKGQVISGCTCSNASAKIHTHTHTHRERERELFRKLSW